MVKALHRAVSRGRSAAPTSPRSLRLGCPVASWWLKPGGAHSRNALGVTCTLSDGMPKYAFVAEEARADLGWSALQSFGQSVVAWPGLVQLEALTKSGWRGSKAVTDGSRLGQPTRRHGAHSVPWCGPGRVVFGRSCLRREQVELAFVTAVEGSRGDCTHPASSVWRRGRAKSLPGTSPPYLTALRRRSRAHEGDNDRELRRRAALCLRPPLTATPGTRHQHVGCLIGCGGGQTGSRAIR